MKQKYRKTADNVGTGPFAHGNAFGQVKVGHNLGQAIAELVHSWKT
jgi:hypothetical protein